MQQKIHKSIGLMSGTSMDGIDLALIKSDGNSIIKDKKFAYFPYSKTIQESLKHLIYNSPTLSEIKEIERELTVLHAKNVNDFLQENNIDNSEIDLIGFHGHTIFHDPIKRLTLQIGDKDLLESLTKIKTINNFRTFDISRGGQGAPLVPIYHFNILKNQEKPTAIINIGGISNISYIPSENEDDIEAFDISFGNAPLDDLMKKKTHHQFDEDGKIAESGKIDYILADRILENEIFNIKPPKSFDRDDFSQIISPINNLELQDALISFAYLHAKAIEKNLKFLPKNDKIKSIYISGGGRKNKTLIDQMRQVLTNIEIKLIDDLGFNGDAIEAEAFAFLAIRMEKKLPISFQKTTGLSPDFGYAPVSSQ